MATTVDSRRETVSLIGSDKSKERQCTVQTIRRSEPCNA